MNRKLHKCKCGGINGNNEAKCCKGIKTNWCERNKGRNFAERLL